MISSKRAKKIAIYIILAISLLFALSPFYWLINTSLKHEGDNFHKPPYFLPPEIASENFLTVITGKGTYESVEFSFPGVLPSIRDSLVVAGTNTILVLFVGAFAAYSISRFRTGGKNLSFWILSIRFLPPIVFIIPLFLLLKTIWLFDTYIGLILVYCSFNLPFAVWFLIGYFEEIPREMEEAAFIDGCSRLGVLWKIVIPIAAPGMVVTVLFCFLFAWNEYIFALLLAGKQVITLPVMLPKFAASFEVFRGMVSAAAIVAIMPAVILAVVLQRFIVRGLSMGAIK